MSKAASKASPRGIIRAHRQTYVSASSGRLRWRDVVLFEGVPFAAAGLCAYFRQHLPTAATSALIAVAAFLSVFLFTAMVTLWSRVADFADGQPEPSADTTRQARDLGELAANSAYAALICVVDAAVFVVASIGHGWVLIASTAIGLGVALHLFLVLLMVMKRVFTQTQANLLRARTGAGRRDRRTDRRASPPAA